MTVDVAQRLAKRVGDVLVRRGQMLVIAESCTGGWVAKVVTSIPGSSQWFDRGYVVYSDVSKQDLLGVRTDTLETHGSVSEAVVCEMALGALDNSQAQVSIAISGIAGPEGGTPDRPVGTVCLGWAVKGHAPLCRSTHFAGDREMVRQQAVMAALKGVLSTIDELGQEAAQTG